MARRDWITLVHRYSARYNVDPEAALAVAQMEGLSGRVGDQGTSFGPFQLHVGGALPRGKGRAWAESPAGIEYAIRQMAKVAGGLRGEAAVRAIVSRFERPANPGKEIAGALARLGSGGGGITSLAGGASDTVGGGLGGNPVASPVPAFTQQDAAMEGLKALSEGTYDPEKGLAALQRAAEATAAAQVQNIKRQNIGSLALPVFASGPKANNIERRAAALVQRYQGTPYVWGGTTPKGFDCSGLLQFVWKQLGVAIPRTTYDQFTAGHKVKGALRPGDAVFFKGSDSKNGLPGHVGMYIGNGRFIEAPHTGSVVHISKLKGRTDYMGARRYA